MSLNLGPTQERIEALPGQLRHNLIDCDIVSHQQVESLWSDTRAGSEALPGQLRRNLIDGDIVSHQQVESLRSGAEALPGHLQSHLMEMLDYDAINWRAWQELLFQGYRGSAQVLLD